MLLCKGSRGWISGVDVGKNVSYYLHAGVWNFTFSPDYYWYDNHSSVFYVDSLGSIKSAWVQSIGGVHIHELCF